MYNYSNIKGQDMFSQKLMYSSLIRYTGSINDNIQRASIQENKYTGINDRPPINMKKPEIVCTTKLISKRATTCIPKS